MTVTHQSETRIDIELPNGKSIILMYAPKQDELSMAFYGKGHRYVKEMQNREYDGYSGCTFTKQE